VWKKAPEALKHWRPGASAQEIQQVEGTLGITFPEEVKTSWMIQDGTRLAFAASWHLLSMHQILEEHRQHKTWPWWPPTWVAFASNDCGDYLCVDSDPTTDEQSGQVMHLMHDAENSRLASAFPLLMSYFVNDLLDGEYEVNPCGEFESDDYLFPH
jgi:cell wall assembly regulator SMI1